MSNDTLRVDQAQETGPWRVYNASQGQPGDPIQYDFDALAFEASKLPKAGTTLIDADPFRLVVAEPTGPPKTGRLEIAAKIWEMPAPGYRGEVLEAFDQFLGQLDDLEGKGVVPGVTGLLRQVMATVIPATFAESLYFNYSLYFGAEDRPRAYVDLQASMRLRLDTQVRQLVSPPDVSGSAEGESALFDPLVNGYVGTGSTFLHLIETPALDGTPRLGFDAFIAGAPLPQVAAERGGAGGIIDLRNSPFRRRYFRLCLPATFPSSDGAGFVGTARNFTLLGADSRPALEQATDAYYASEPLGADVVSAFFRGRMVLVPELLTFLNGEPVYLPVSTTVRQFIRRYASFPRVPGLNVNNGNLPYERYRPSVQFAAGGQFPNYYSQLSFAVTSATDEVLTTDAYDLPVLAADAFNFALPS